MQGKLIVVCGGMFSGKSTTLMEKGERLGLAKKKVAFIAPKIDTRFGSGKVVTHFKSYLGGEQLKVDAISSELDHLSSRLREYEVVLIDEVQFFEMSVVEDIKALVRKGKIVMCAGLDMDFNGDTFEVTKELLGLADEIYKNKAVCSRCGEDATFSARVSEEKEKIVLGEKDKYIPLCRECYSKFRKGEF